MSMSRIKTFAIASFVAAALAGGASVLSAQTTAPPAGDAKHGYQLFQVNGCYECHNTLGQGTGSRAPGAGPGPNLAPAPIPYAAFVRQVRNPRQSMPPYDAKLVSDQDLADMYAFLASQPPAKDPHSIALLKDVTVGTATSTPRGAVVYAANCATCHGGSGQGGVGPALRNESTKKDAAAVAAFVRNPPAAGLMPKLSPGMLSDSDVTAVAAYVETLK
jgi:ubiquinol-cytochrome c reductase cytochrome c subunit